MSVQFIGAGDCEVNLNRFFDRFEHETQLSEGKLLHHRFPLRSKAITAGYWMLKANPYREIFAAVDLRLEETGIMQTFFYTPKFPKARRLHPVTALSIGHLYYAFLTTAGLFGLAVVFMFFEAVAAARVSLSLSNYNFRLATNELFYERFQINPPADFGPFLPTGQFFAPKLIILIKCLMFYFSKCCFNVSLCRTRCEFGIAIMFKS